MRDQICTLCGRNGHRAHRCPRAKHALPWTTSTFWVSAIVVALIASVAAYA